MMLQITPHMRILVAVEPADFRRGIDSLARLCRESLGQDPFGGAVFVFRNRRATALKVLVYDGQGFWLCHKRLSQGRFPWWPSASEKGAGRLAAHQLAVLLAAGDPTRTGAPADCRPVGPLV
jgi:transposase